MTPEQERRAKVRASLERLREDDASARERERIGALSAMLTATFGIICVGAIPVAANIRFLFIFVALCFAAVVGLTIKRWLDERAMR